MFKIIGVILSLFVSFPAFSTSLIADDDSKEMTAKYCRLIEEGMKISAESSFSSLDLSKKITLMHTDEILDNAILKDIETLDVGKERKHMIVQKGKPICYVEFYPYSNVMSKEIILKESSFKIIDGEVSVVKSDNYIRYLWDEDGTLITREERG